MTDTDLLELLKNGGHLYIPYFAGTRIEIMCEDVSPEMALPALRNFLGQTVKDRDADSRHLHAYLELMRDVCGPEIAEHIPDISDNLPKVWDYARPTLLFFGQRPSTTNPDHTKIYLQIEGNVDWEEEHGLQMSWENGERLVKVSAFDGHPTNSSAYADDSRDAYIFYCYNPKFATRP